MQAVLKPTPRSGFTVGEVPEPRPGPGQVLLRVEAASVCGTDVHLYDWDAWAEARVTPPRVMGHEVCGAVRAWGEGVRSPAIGTRVAVESHIVCGHCEECRRGDFHVCENTRILGVDVDGGFAAQVAVPAANVRAVGDSVSSAVAAAMEPVGNAVHACSYGELDGRTVVVFGCGPIGCASVAVARVLGAAQVIAVDRNAYRLQLAERMGASSLVRANAAAVDREVLAAASGDIDCALEMSGSPVAVASATRLVRPGGWISLLGIGEPVTMDVTNDVVMKGLSLFGVVGRKLPTTWDRTLAYVRDGVIDIEPLITHNFAMHEIDRAMELIKSGDCGKVALTPD
jgi:threonine 3-dehydrogenase